MLLVRLAPAERHSEYIFCSSFFNPQTPHSTTLQKSFWLTWGNSYSSGYQRLQFPWRVLRKVQEIHYRF
jgi:hypothetical protein